VPSVNNSSAAAPSTDRLAENLCFQLCMILEITPKVARALLGDPESYDEEGNPEMNRALALFWKNEALKERACRQEDHEMFQQQSDQHRESLQRSAAEQRPAPQQVVRGGGFTQTLETPEDWDVGFPPKGGLHYATFRKKLNEVQRYNRKTGDLGPKLTVKSLVSQDLKAGMEARCGLNKNCWNIGKRTIFFRKV
jgi:hypothetical protein